MQLGNPLPVFLGIPLMACFCWLLARWVPILDSAPAHNSKTLPLDGLRGILASAVLFHHAYITYGLFRTGIWATPVSDLYAQLGPTAVTLFFFISGYLFWRKMLKDPSSLRPSRLLPNRIRRIMPAYLAAVMFFFLLVAWLTHFHRLVSFGSLAFQSTSWVLGGFPVLGGPVLNTIDPLIACGGIFWTLQQEWLFYLLLPLLTWFRPILKLLLLVFLFVLAQRIILHVPATSVLAVDVHRLLERFFRMFVAGFSVGMLAAYDIPNAKIIGLLRSPWMALVAILFVACQLFLLAPAPPTRGAIYSSLLLIPAFFVAVNGNDFCGLLSSAPMRCLGTVSYSLYVFHGMILRSLTLTIDRYDPIRSMTPLHYWLWILPVSFVVVLWSTLSYYFIERPFFARRKAVP